LLASNHSGLYATSDRTCTSVQMIAAWQCLELIFHQGVPFSPSTLKVMDRCNTPKRMRFCRWLWFHPQVLRYWGGWGFWGFWLTFARVQWTFCGFLSICLVRNNSSLAQRSYSFRSRNTCKPPQTLHSPATPMVSIDFQSAASLILPTYSSLPCPPNAASPCTDWLPLLFAWGYWGLRFFPKLNKQHTFIR
jgi:hypothetical protein